LYSVNRRNRDTGEKFSASEIKHNRIDYTDIKLSTEKKQAKDNEVY
jgi:hypothetical protein